MELEQIIPGILKFNECKEGLLLKDSDKVLEHCLTIINGMKKRQTEDTIKRVDFALGRIQDPYLALPPDALYDLLPLLYEGIFKKDNLKVMRFLRTYCNLVDSKLFYTVTINYEDILNDIKRHKARAYIFFKLFEQNKEFRDLPLQEKKSLLLNPKFVDTSLADILEPLLEYTEEDSKLIIFGPNKNRKIKEYDALRLMLEDKVYQRVERRYSKHQNIILTREKNIDKGINMAREIIYPNLH